MWKDFDWVLHSGSLDVDTVENRLAEKIELLQRFDYKRIAMVKSKSKMRRLKNEFKVLKTWYLAHTVFEGEEFSEIMEDIRHRGYEVAEEVAVLEKFISHLESLPEDSETQN